MFSTKSLLKVIYINDTSRLDVRFIKLCFLYRDQVNNLAEEEKEEREKKIESESDPSQSSEVTGQTSDLFSGGPGSPEEWIYEGNY